MGNNHARMGNNQARVINNNVFVQAYVRMVLDIKTMPIFKGKIKTWDDLIMFLISGSPFPFHLDIFPKKAFVAGWWFYYYRSYVINNHCIHGIPNNNYLVMKLFYSFRHDLNLPQIRYMRYMGLYCAVDVSGACPNTIASIRQEVKKYRAEVIALMQLYNVSNESCPGISSISVDVFDLFLELSAEEEEEEEEEEAAADNVLATATVVDVAPSAPPLAMAEII